MSVMEYVIVEEKAVIIGRGKARNRSATVGRLSGIVASIEIRYEEITK